MNKLKNNIDSYIEECFYKTKNIDYNLPRTINERTFVFRFGHYLANDLENNTGYSVDVDYNRCFDDPKRQNNNLIIPDLIIHKRGINDNLVAIEFKKNNDSSKDRDRLVQLMQDSNYLYKNVYFIIINKNVVEKYENGEWNSILGDVYE